MMLPKSKATHMTQLNDTQSMLLSHASRMGEGSLYPLPKSLLNKGQPAPRTVKAIDELIGRGLLEEREATSIEATARRDGDLNFGLFVTALGLTLIGVDDAGDGGVPPEASLPPAPVSRVSKTEQVLTLLRRQEGATSAELMAATGWLAHTVRAALTGLRKKGHVVDRVKRGTATCYRIAG
jgi:hypothetical protein